MKPWTELRDATKQRYWRNPRLKAWQKDSVAAIEFMRVHFGNHTAESWQALVADAYDDDDWRDPFPTHMQWNLWT